MRRLTLALMALCSASCDAIWANLTEPNLDFDCTAAGSSCATGQVCNPQTLQCDAPCAPGSQCIPCDANTGAAALVTALRQQSEQSRKTIQLSPGCTYTFNEPADLDMGPSALPAIRSDVVIEGNGATLQRADNAAPFRFFYVAPPPASGRVRQLTLRNLTLSGGLAQGGHGGAAVTQPVGPGSGGGGAGLGGAVFSQGSLVLDGVTLKANQARGGNGRSDITDVTLGVSMVVAKAGGGGGGLRGNGQAAGGSYYGGGGGGFRPETPLAPQGGSGVSANFTEGGTVNGVGGVSSDGPPEIQGTQNGGAGTSNPPAAGVGGGALGAVSWLGGSGGGCGPSSSGSVAGANGGGGGFASVKAGTGMGEAKPGGGGGGFYSYGGDGTGAREISRGGGGGAYGGGGGGGGGTGGPLTAAGGGGGGVGGGGGGGTALLSGATALGAGGGGGGGFGGGGGGGSGSSTNTLGEFNCSGGMGGFGGGGGSGVTLTAIAGSRFGGGSGGVVAGKSAWGGGGMGAGGAIFALGGQVTVKNSTILGNAATGGVGALGGQGLGAGIFAVAGEVSLQKTTVTGNSAKSGESKLATRDVFQKPSRGAGLFVLDPGEKAPITGTSAAVELVDSNLTGNVAETAEAGADVTLEYEALQGGARLGTVRSRGSATGQPVVSFSESSPPTNPMNTAGCSVSSRRAGGAASGLPALLGLLGLWLVRRSRTSPRRRLASGQGTFSR